jgi:hypothetical protein
MKKNNFLIKVFLKLRVHINDGVTLTELLVSSMLIGIVMIGVISFSTIFDQMQETDSMASLLSTQASFMMGEMKRDAMLAVGDNLNRGIAVQDLVSDKGICFRHDTNNPAVYTDDRWVCYAHGSSWHVKRCVGNSGLAPCFSCFCAGYVISDDRFPRTALSKNAASFFQLMTDTEGRIEGVRFNIVAMDRDSNATAYHPITNPQYTLTAEVHPPGHSR